MQMAERSGHRRKYPRIPSQNAVLVKQLGGKEAEGFAKTTVVGLGGCMFTCDEAFGQGSYLDLFIAIQHTVVKALSKVAYERKQEDERYEIGVEFVQINETDRKLLETLWANNPDLRHGDWD